MKNFVYLRNTELYKKAELGLYSFIWLFYAKYFHLRFLYYIQFLYYVQFPGISSEFLPPRYSFALFIDCVSWAPTTDIITWFFDKVLHVTFI